MNDLLSSTSSSIYSFADDTYRSSTCSSDSQHLACIYISPYRSTSVLTFHQLFDNYSGTMIASFGSIKDRRGRLSFHVNIICLSRTLVIGGGGSRGIAPKIFLDHALQNLANAGKHPSWKIFLHFLEEKCLAYSRILKSRESYFETVSGPPFPLGTPLVNINQNFLCFHEWSCFHDPIHVFNFFFTTLSFIFINLTWKLNIHSIAKHTSQKLGSFSRTLSQLLAIYKSQIHPSLEYCSHVYGGTPKSSLRLLVKVHSNATRLINHPGLIRSLQSLSYHRLVADLSIFYRYIHGHSFLEIRNIITDQVRCVRAIRSSTYSFSFSLILKFHYIHHSNK